MKVYVTMATQANDFQVSWMRFFKRNVSYDLANDADVNTLDIVTNTVKLVLNALWHATENAIKWFVTNFISFMCLYLCQAQKQPHM